MALASRARTRRCVLHHFHLHGPFRWDHKKPRFCNYCTRSVGKLRPSRDPHVPEDGILRVMSLSDLRMHMVLLLLILPPFLLLPLQRLRLPIIRVPGQAFNVDTFEKYTDKAREIRKSMTMQSLRSRELSPRRSFSPTRAVSFSQHV